MCSAAPIRLVEPGPFYFAAARRNRSNISHADMSDTTMRSPADNPLTTSTDAGEAWPYVTNARRSSPSGLSTNTLDTALGTFAAWQMFFFFTAAMLFINVHHYFIDNVLWRFKNPEVRAYLLS